MFLPREPVSRRRLNMLCTLRVMSPALEMHFLSNFIKQAAHTPNLNYPLCLSCAVLALSHRARADKNKARLEFSHKRAGRYYVFFFAPYSVVGVLAGRCLGSEDAPTCWVRRPNERKSGLKLSTGMEKIENVSLTMKPLSQFIHSVLLGCKERNCNLSGCRTAVSETAGYWQFAKK